MSISFYNTCLIMSMVVYTTTIKTTIKLNDFFTHSSYAQLLKEIIIMADTVGLLDNRLDEDERNFIQDSILGKILRISRLIPHMEPALDIDKAYLMYWLNLAKMGNISPFIADEISSLAHTINDHFQVL